MDDFAAAVRAGLSQKDKRISSRFFYDAAGDALFQKIMQLEEYYPTRCEREIFESQKEAMAREAAFDRPFQLAELGAGDGQKTEVLLGHFLATGLEFTYHPIDISASVLEQLRQRLGRNLPQLNIEALHQEYFEALAHLGKIRQGPLLVLLLGGNIGNFTSAQALEFLSQLAAKLQSGDRLLMGVDLKKEPAVIRQAYNDREGVTSAFNLNLLRRINRELEADFNLAQFAHYPSYNPETGECRSYLISNSEQEVYLKKLDLKVHFEAFESIHTEISKKFSASELRDLAQNSGFRSLKDYRDGRGYFSSQLWERP